MKLSHINIYFITALIVCTSIRVFQLVFTIDPLTGFVLSQYSSIAASMTVIVFVSFAAAAVFCLFAKKDIKPVKKTGKLCGIASFILSLSICADMISRISAQNEIGEIGLSLIDIFAFASAVFFIIFGLSAFLDFKVSGAAFAVPVIYFIVKLINIFIKIAYIALITDNVFLIAGICFTLVFMLEFAKAYNGFEKDIIGRKLLIGAYGAIFFNVCACLPQLICKFSGKNISFSQGSADCFLMLAAALFAAGCVFEYFKPGVFNEPSEIDKKI